MLGGIPELLEAGLASSTFAGVAEAPAGAPQPGKLEIERATPEDDGAVTVIVLLTVSVIVVAAAQPAPAPAELWKPAFSIPGTPPTADELAGTTVIVFVVDVEVSTVVVGSAEVIA
jgi:hypothetical protein